MSTALAPRSSYIPWLFVAGFAVVISVNAIMITFAVSSFSGLYTPKPRDRGLNYNAVVAAQHSRDALGWRIETAWRSGADRLEIAVSDVTGQPLAGTRVSAELVRPAEKRPPIAVGLVEAGTGRFAGRADLPARGNWDLDIVVERADQRYAVTRRVFLQ